MSQRGQGRTDGAGGENMIDDGERLLTVEEVAVRLRVSGRTVRRMLTSGALVGFRVHRGAWRVRPADLDAYVAGAMRAASVRVEAADEAVRAAAARVIGQAGGSTGLGGTGPVTAQRLVDIDAIIGPPDRS